jgi:hypothetical protein
MPHVEKLLAVKLRNGVELVEYPNVEYATPRGGLRNAERFSGGRHSGIREHVVPTTLWHKCSIDLR